MQQLRLDGDVTCQPMTPTEPNSIDHRHWWQHPAGIIVLAMVGLGLLTTVLVQASSSRAIEDLRDDSSITLPPVAPAPVIPTPVAVPPSVFGSDGPSSRFFTFVVAVEEYFRAIQRNQMAEIVASTWSGCEAPLDKFVVDELVEPIDFTNRGWDDPVIVSDNLAVVRGLTLEGSSFSVPFLYEDGWKSGLCPDAKTSLLAQLTVPDDPVLVAGLDFAGENLDSQDLIRGDFNGARFAEASLHEAYLSGSQLSFADFRGADLTKAFLPGVWAIFEGPDFTGAAMDQVGMWEADMANTNFTNVVATLGDFSGSNLRGSTFDGADLTGALFVGADLVDSSWRNTICPDGYVASDDGTDSCLHHLDF